MSLENSTTYVYAIMISCSTVSTFISDKIFLHHQVYGGVTVGDFEVRWQHWQSECERRLEEGHFAGSHHLRVICKVSYQEYVWTSRVFLWQLGVATQCTGTQSVLNASHRIHLLLNMYSF